MNRRELAIPAGRRHHRRLIALAIGTLAAVVPTSAAVAFWRTTPHGNAAAYADTLRPAGKPTVRMSGHDAVVTWNPSTFAKRSGQGGISYTVERTSSGGDAAGACTPPTVGRQATSLAAIAVVEAPTTCTDVDVPDGTWLYVVTAHFEQWVAISDASVAVIVDRTPPTITLTVPTPTGQHGWFDGPVDVAVLVEDASPPITCTVSIDDAPASPLPGCGPVHVTTDGEHHVVVAASDAASNTGSSPTVTVNVDQTAPLVPALTLPRFVGYSLHLALAPTDSPSGVATVEWLACPGTTCAPTAAPALTTVTGPPLDYAFDWSPAVDGAYRLRARVTDNAGNTGLSNVQSVLVDTVAPTVLVTSPQTGAVVGGSGVSFAANAGDIAGSGVANVRFEYRHAGTEDAWTLLLDPPGAGAQGLKNVRPIANADYEVRAIATDRASNETTSAPVAFTIRNWQVASALLNNHSGGTRGRIETSDSIALAFSQPLSPTSVCGAWTNAGAQAAPVTVHVVDGGINGDQLTFDSPDCTAGSITLGSASYVTGGDVTFTGVLGWSPDNTRLLTITVGANLAGGELIGTAPAGLRAVYAPASSLKSSDGVPINPTVARTNTTIQF